MFRDIRDFVDELRRRNDIVEVDEELSVDLEVAALLRELAYRKGPAVLIRRTREGTLPILGNLFGTWERILLALNNQNPEDLASRITELINIRPPEGLIEGLKALNELRKLAQYFPKNVSRGSVREIEWKEIDITRLPAIRQWIHEPGRFLTFGLTFIKYGDYRNFGYYRLQVIGKDRFIMHWQPWRRSAMYAEQSGKVDVAVVFGPDPATMLMGGVPIPHPLDKLLIVGFLRGEGIELIKGITVDVDYPANAELVIEGVLTGDYALEGPFGDHVGTYSIAKYYPVVKVTGIYSREDPMIPVTVTGKPMLEDGNIIRFGESVVKPLLKMLLPEVVDIHIPPEGVSYVLIVSIRKRYPGHAKRVMMALWGLVPVIGKLTIVVDDNVNIRDWGQVVYAMAAHVNPARDVIIINDYPVEELDPSTPIPNLGGRVGIDATRKLPEEYAGKEYPMDSVTNRDIEEKIKALLSRILSKSNK